MKFRFLILSVVLAVFAQAALPQEAIKPLGKDQVSDLVKFGLDSGELAKRIEERGIDFEPTDEYLGTLRKAGAQETVIHALREARPQPLTREQVGELVAGGVPSQRATMLVKQHGLDFVADERYLQTLRLAGGEDTLIVALREASAKVTAGLALVTSPNAEVYLDGELQGKAGAQGEFVVNAKPGAHALKVLLKGKKDVEQTITLAARQVTRVEARMEDLAGNVVVQTSPGAAVFIDESSRGTTDARGQLTIPEVTAGSHELRITAPGKKEYRQKLSVPAGKEARIETQLEDDGLSPGRVHAQDAIRVSDRNACTVVHSYLTTKFVRDNAWLSWGPRQVKDGYWKGVGDGQIIGAEPTPSGIHFRLKRGREQEVSFEYKDFSSVEKIFFSGDRKLPLINFKPAMQNRDGMTLDDRPLDDGLVQALNKLVNDAHAGYPCDCTAP